MIIRFLLYSLLLLFYTGLRAADAGPIVAVATNFTPAVEEIINHFAAETGVQIRISTGASGTLVRQIEQGAPFELFLSADEAYVERLDAEGLSVDAGRIYATGQLILFIPNTSKQDINQEIPTLLQQSVADKSYRIAIANPELAPYGHAAQQVLDRFNLWPLSKDQLILGENVGQTAQFALTGTIDAAFLPYSLAISEQLRNAGQFKIIPLDWYTPINQRMVLLKNAGSTAREFYNYISGKIAQQIIRSYGYEIPSD